VADLSILIPSRNEQFLQQTIGNILENIEGDTEIVAILDGEWANPPVVDHPRVTLIYHPESVGQRAGINEAARISKARYVMKCDAHCAFAPGFDVALMADCEPDWMVIPRMYNLHAFDWICKKCGKEQYQGGYPVKCANKECDNITDFEQMILWKPRRNRKTDFARFNSDLRFKYWGAYKKRPGSDADIADTMCFVGAAWFLTRERYWEIGGCDEGHGSWGQQGVEMACKSWLSGGRVVVNKKTWFSHMFRTQKGFGFPYSISGSDQQRAREYSSWLWRDGNWDKAIHPLSWLLEKFWPVPGWTEEELVAQKERENEMQG